MGGDPSAAATASRVPVSGCDFFNQSVNRKPVWVTALPSWRKKFMAPVAAMSQFRSMACLTGSSRLNEGGEADADHGENGLTPRER